MILNFLMCLIVCILYRLYKMHIHFQIMCLELLRVISLYVPIVNTSLILKFYSSTYRQRYGLF